MNPSPPFLLIINFELEKTLEFASSGAKDLLKYSRHLISLVSFPRKAHSSFFNLYFQEDI